LVFFSFIYFNFVLYILFFKKTIIYNTDKITEGLWISNKMTNVISPSKSSIELEKNYKTLRLKITDRLSPSKSSIELEKNYKTLRLKITDRLSPSKSSKEFEKNYRTCHWQYVNIRRVSSISHMNLITDGIIDGLFCL